VITITEKADFFHQQCSGKRPACAGCVRREELCLYDIEEGTTRLQNLGNRLNSAQTELAQTKRFIHNLRYSSDADAAGLLVRLRRGEDIAQLASAEPLHSNWYVRSMNVYQPGPVKLTADKGCQSQNMLTVLIYRYNIPSPILRKLDRHTYTHQLKTFVTTPCPRKWYKHISLINPHPSTPTISPQGRLHTVDTYSSLLFMAARRFEGLSLTEA
jgi:hypothetical protein